MLVYMKYRRIHLSHSCKCDYHIKDDVDNVVTTEDAAPVERHVKNILRWNNSETPCFVYAPVAFIPELDPQGRPTCPSR